MNSQRGLIALPILLAVFLGVLVVSGGAYYVLHKRPQPAPIQQPINTQPVTQAHPAPAENIPLETVPSTGPLEVKASGVAPKTFTFTIKQAGAQINFGDGTNPCSPLTPGFIVDEKGCHAPASPQSFTHTYATTGTYNVTVSGQSSSTTVGTASVKIANNPPVQDYTNPSIDLGTCDLTVDGVNYVVDPCNKQDNGKYGIDYGTRGSKYFVYGVNTTDVNGGWWNGATAASHAQDPLPGGKLTKLGNCYQNSRVKFCE